MVKVVQNSFLGGQLDFEMMGRQDVERYARGATVLKNFLPLKRGAIRKRPGTDLRHDVTAKIVGGRYRLVPFAYRQDEGWALLFTEGAIWAFSRTSMVRVEADAGVPFYTGDQIAGFDFCQSGDILYLAHQTHAPCRIEHRVSGATHSFTLKAMDMNVASKGVPYVDTATVSKTGITTKGPTVTESYRVAAVFDGQETFPSAVFASGTANDYDSGYNAWRAEIKAAEAKGKVSTLDYQPVLRTYNGTSYTPPWTTSQKITLTIKVRPRQREDGTWQWPERVNIYRKTGSVYGLVGFVDTSSYESDVDVTEADAELAGDVEPTDTGSGLVVPAKRDLRWDGEVYGTLRGGEMEIALSGMVTGVDLTICPGHLEGVMTNASGWAWDDQVDRGDPFFYNGNVDNPTPCWYYGANGAVAARKAQSGAFVDGFGEEEAVDLRTQAAAYEGLKLTFKGGLVARYGRIARFTFTKCLPGGGTATVKAELSGGGETSADFSLGGGTDATIVYRTASFAGEDAGSQMARSLDGARTYLKTLDAAPDETVELHVGGRGDRVTLTFSGGSYAGADATVGGIHLKGYVTAPTVSGGGTVQTVQWDDRYYTPDASLTPPARRTYMDGAGEYPACVCLSQQRLVWASTLNDPARVIMSQIGNFASYAPHDAMVDDDPIDFQISATRFPKVNHIVELRKLLMFNGDAEWVVDSAAANSGLTYATIQARQHSSIGAAAWLKPIVCNNVILFAERTGQAVRQYGYQLEDDGYGGEDVSIFSSSIFRGRRIVSWAYQQHPHSTCWCVLSDGTLCSLTFMREQRTVAWATHGLGGGGLAKAVVCTHAVTGGADGPADTSQVFVLVARGDVWTVEEMRRDCRHGSDAVAAALCLDSVRTLSGGARRAGTVAVDPATGAVRTEGGEAGWLEGYPFESVFESVYPVTGSEVGLAQMDVKCVQAAHLRVADAVGGTVRASGTPEDQADRLAETRLAVADGTVALPSVDETVPLRGNNTRDGRVVVAQGEPWPFTLLMLETDVECEEDGRRRG